MSIACAWRCSVCGDRYDTREEADACESPPKRKPLAVVGDIVLMRAGFGWYDGDKRWISNPECDGKNRRKLCPNGDSNCFGVCCTFAFYYVVTAVDHHAGAWRYHVRTLAMSDQQPGYSRGWTKVETHYSVRRVDPATVPVAVLKSSKGLLGEKFKYSVA